MSEAEVKCIDLNINRSLINAKFDNYKLSLERLNIKELSLPVGVPDLQPSDSQFSLEQAKIFAHAGQLYFDSWNSTDALSVFILPQNDGNLYRVEYNIETSNWSELKKIVSIDKAEGQALPFSVVFPSQDVAVLANGSTNVVIYKTTESRNSWEKVFAFSPFESSGIYIQDARVMNGQMDILIESVVDHEKTSPDDHKVYDLIVAWVSLGTDPIQVLRKQDVSLPGFVNFITLDETAENLVVNSSEPPKVLADTDGLLPSQKIEETMETDDKKHYVWTERGDEVAIAFSLEPSVKKEAIAVKPGANDILITVGGNVILNGRLGGHIQPESATWTLGDTNKLEVTLFKRDADARWSFLVEGNDFGKYELDPALLDEATAALEKFSSDQKAPGVLGASETFNAAQNEECDMTEEPISTIYWYNKQKQAIVQQCDITGHQFLFETKIPGNPSKVCIRYDVDGMIFSLHNDQLINEAALTAFGYIQASKTNRRWCVSPPDHSYVALAESNNHAFIYRQMSAVGSELVNRKTKEKVASVAKQHVISLKKSGDMMDTDELKNCVILAAHAINKVLYLLTEETLYAISVE